MRSYSTISSKSFMALVVMMALLSCMAMSIVVEYQYQRASDDAPITFTSELPAGSTFSLDVTDNESLVEITFSLVDVDNDDAVLETISFDPAEEGSKAFTTVMSFGQTYKVLNDASLDDFSPTVVLTCNIADALCPTTEGYLAICQAEAEDDKKNGFCRCQKTTQTFDDESYECLNVPVLSFIANNPDLPNSLITNDIIFITGAKIGVMVDISAENTLSTGSMTFDLTFTAPSSGDDDGEGDGDDDVDPAPFKALDITNPVITVDLATLAQAATKSDVFYVDVDAVGNYVLAISSFEGTDYAYETASIEADVVLDCMSNTELDVDTCVNSTCLATTAKPNGECTCEVTQFYKDEEGCVDYLGSFYEYYFITEVGFTAKQLTQEVWIPGKDESVVGVIVRPEVLGLTQGTITFTLTEVVVPDPDTDTDPDTDPAPFNILNSNVITVDLSTILPDDEETGLFPFSSLVVGKAYTIQISYDSDVLEIPDGALVDSAQVNVDAVCWEYTSPDFIVEPTISTCGAAQECTTNGCACPDPNFSGPDCDQPAPPTLAFEVSVDAGANFAALDADVFAHITPAVQVKVTFSNIFVAGKAFLVASYGLDEQGEAIVDEISATFAVDEEDFELTLPLTHYGKPVIQVRYTNGTDEEELFPSTNAPAKVSLVLECQSTTDGSDSCPAGIAACKVTDAAPDGTCQCNDHTKYFDATQTADEDKCVDYAAPEVTYQFAVGEEAVADVDSAIYIPSDAKLSVTVSTKDIVGVANTGVLTFKITPYTPEPAPDDDDDTPDDTPEPFKVTEDAEDEEDDEDEDEEPVDSYVITFDLAAVEAATDKVLTKSFGTDIAAGKYKIVASYGQDVPLAADAIDVSEEINLEFPCLDFTGGYLVEPTTNICGVDGECLATGCQCNDGFTGEVCDVEMTEPTVVVTYLKMEAETTPVTLIPDQTLALADLATTWTVTLTSGNVAGEATVTIIDLDDATKNLEYPMVAFEATTDDANPVTTQIPIDMTLGGNFQIQVAYTIVGWIAPEDYESPSVILKSACWTYDADADAEEPVPSWVDSCVGEGKHGTCGAQGVCVCSSGWGGDMCDELLRIPIAITVPSIADVEIKSTESYEDGDVIPTIIVAAGAAIKVALTPQQGTDIPSMTSDVTVTMSYYPLLSNSATPSAQPVILSTKVVKFDNAAVGVDLVAPALNAKTIFITVDVASTLIPAYNFNTIQFSVLPTCYTQPTTGLDVPANWINQCQNSGICTVENTCACTKGYYGSKCEYAQSTDPINPCEVCVSENLDTCNKDTEFTDRTTPCKCKKDFGGLTCAERNKCLLDSLKTCGYDQWRGKFETLADGTCAKQCTCDGNWSGEKCGTCNLTCLNDGEAYKGCTYCGCAAGFAGSSCECKSAVLQLVLNGKNDVIEATKGVYANGVYDPSSNNDVALNSVLTDFDEYFAQLLAVELNKVSVVAFPEAGNTRFNITLQYACNNSPTPAPFVALVNAKNIDELNTEWTGLAAQVPEGLGHRVNYGTATPAVVSTKALESDSTLPGPGEGVNSGASIGMVFAFVAVVLAVMF